MGICGSNKQEYDIPIHVLIDQLERLERRSHQQQDKIKKRIDLNQTQLLNEFNKSALHRNKEEQTKLIKININDFNMKTIYKVIEQQVKKILLNQQCLKNEESLKNILPSLSIIICCAQFMDNQVLVELRNKFIQKYQNLRRIDLRRSNNYLIHHYLNSNRITQVMKEEYFHIFCQNYQISLQQINLVEHNIN